MNKENSICRIVNKKLICSMPVFILQINVWVNKEVNLWSRKVECKGRPRRSEIFAWLHQGFST